MSYDNDTTTQSVETQEKMTKPGRKPSGMDLVIAKYPEAFQRFCRDLRLRGSWKIGDAIQYYANLGLPPFRNCNPEEMAKVVLRAAQRTKMRWDPNVTPINATLNVEIWTSEAWNALYKQPSNSDADDMRSIREAVRPKF